jgi:hypothetical protein
VTGEDGIAALAVRQAAARQEVVRPARRAARVV